MKKNTIWNDSYDFIFSIKFLFPATSILLIFLFKDYYIELYESKVVNTILYKIKGYFIPLVLWILSLVYLLKKLFDRHRFRLGISFAVFTISFVYIYHRFIESPNTFDFYRFPFFSVAYADIVLVSLVIFALLFFINDGRYFVTQYILQASGFDPPQKGFLPDTALKIEKDSMSIDLFGWEPKAIQLVNKIKESNVPHSFAIGISSEWGSGKTSFFNLIKKSLNEGRSQDYLYFDFNPWFSSDIKTIIEDFFNSFEDATKTYDSKLSSNLLMYANRLQGLSSDVLTKVLHSSISLMHSHPDLTQRYVSINDSIRRLDKKIIVFIDDLDRLSKHEIIEVLRIVRNTSNFYNTYFIVAYDREYVNQAVKEINEYNYHKYLDKIVQYEMMLPIYDYRVLNDVFLEKISTYLAVSESEQKEFFMYLPIYSNKFETGEKLKDLINDEKYINIFDYLKNIREINRFLNQFLFDYSFLKNVVCFRDYLFLSILKFTSYPIWYVLSSEETRMVFLRKGKDQLCLRDKDYIQNILKENTALLFQPAHIGFLENSITKFLKPLLPNAINSQLSQEELQDTLDRNFSPPLDEVNKIFQLLEKIFPDQKGNEKDYSSIVYQPNYYLYFYGDTSISSRYSLAKFNSDLNNLSVSTEDFVKDLIEKSKEVEINKLLNLIHIVGNSYKNSMTFEKIVFAHSALLYKRTAWPVEEVMKIIERLKKGEGESINERVKVQVFYGLVDKYERTFDESCFIAFFIQQLLLLYSRRENQGMNQSDLDKVFVVKKERLQEISVKILNKWQKELTEPHFTKGRTIYSLFYSCISNITTNTNKVKILPEALKIFRKAAIKHPGDYFSSLIRSKYTPSSFEPSYVLEPYVLLVFDGYRNEAGELGFERFLKEQGDKNGLSSLPFKRILHMYSVLAVGNKSEEDLHDYNLSVLFDNFEEWNHRPLATPINDFFERENQEDIKNVLNKICSQSRSLYYLA